MFNARYVMYMTIFHIIFTSELVVEIKLCYSGFFCWRRVRKVEKLKHGVVPMIRSLNMAHGVTMLTLLTE